MIRQVLRKEPLNDCTPMILGSVNKRNKDKNNSNARKENHSEQHEISNSGDKWPRNFQGVHDCLIRR